MRQVTEATRVHCCETELPRNDAAIDAWGNPDRQQRDVENPQQVQFCRVARGLTTDKYVNKLLGNTLFIN